jgi:putative colanic acid biosynthesis UDP-glucose lipid carrier transferase
MFDATPYSDQAEGCFRSDRPVAPVAVSRSKRVFDVVVALALLLFLAPLLTVIAVSVLLDSRGPALFRQRRTGLHGRVFTIYKFRTMSVMEDGDDLAHATRDDQRVTRVGAFLRKSSLDELPQLFNVLRGDMSIVGPRPHAVAHDTKYASVVPNYWERFRARPGLTGLAQIAGLRGEVDGANGMARRVEEDLRYLRDWSLRLDISIILRTAPLLLRDSNAY